MSGLPRTISQNSDPRIGGALGPPVQTASAEAVTELSARGPSEKAGKARNPFLPRPQQLGQENRRLNSLSAQQRGAPNRPDSKGT